MLKKPDLNKPGFDHLAKHLIKCNLCVLCEAQIKEEEFNDQADKDEYAISGICQVCIDQVFEPTEEEFNEMLDSLEMDEIIPEQKIF